MEIKIKITIGRNELELTIDEVKELKELLDKILSKEETVIKPLIDFPVPTPQKTLPGDYWGGPISSVIPPLGWGQ